MPEEHLQVLEHSHSSSSWWHKLFLLSESQSSPLHPDHFGSLPSPLSSGYWGLLSQEVKELVMKLTTHLHLVLRLRMCGAIPPLPQYVSMLCYLVKHRKNFTSLPLSESQHLFHTYLLSFLSSSVGIVLGYGLDVWGSRVGAGNFSLHHRVQNGSGAHPASYPVGTRSSFSGGKASRAWSWPLASI
jgi:hypothetical protein